MRLSELLKNKPDAETQPVRHRHAVQGPAHRPGLASSSTPPEPVPAPPALEPVPAPPPAPTEPVPATPAASRVPPQSAADAPKAAPVSPPPPASAPDTFDNQPVGLYEAARQLGIVIPQSRAVILRKSSECLSTVFDLLMSETSNKDVIWPMVKSIATDIDGVVQEDSNVVASLYEYREDRARLVWHSLYTAVLAMNLARHVNHLDAPVQDIGGAALLHDVGLLAIQTGATDWREHDTITFLDHIRLGVEMVTRIHPPPAVLTMIGQHHRRSDADRGIIEGYGDVFRRCSQVVASSNVCEHAVFGLANAGANDSDAHGDLSGLFTQYRKAYDSDLLKSMILLIGFYPVGSMVELNNRSICEVVCQNEGLPLRPVVRVVVDGTGVHPDRERVIDLKQVRVLTVTRAVAYARRKS